MKKICIIGGCGHVGIPLGLAFASRKNDVTLVDVNPKAVEARADQFEIESNP